MADTAIGFVSNIATRDGKTYTTLVLNYEELRDNPLILGEFVKVKTGAYYKGNDNTYLGMVTASQYRPITYDKFQEALALGRLNQLQPDENTVKNINFLHYDIVLLGSYTYSDKEPFKFYPSTRQIPSLIDITISHLESKELQVLVNASIQVETNNSKKSFLTNIGFLRIGSAASGEHKSVTKQVDISNFRGKRTANFGKTGFGKSNENKVILTLLKQNYPKMGMLIFDVNGEYAAQTTENSSVGLIKVFEKLNIQNNILWFTNRKSENTSPKPYELSPIKINFFKEPWLAIELAYQRHMLSGGGQVQYLEAAREGLNPDGGDWIRTPNRMAYVYGAFLKMNLKPHNIIAKISDKEYNLQNEEERVDFLEKLNEGIEKADTKNKGENGGARDLYRYAGRLAFLKSLHTENNIDEFFDRAMKATISGKTVIVDLPTVRPELVDFLSARLANNVFNEALKRYAENSGNDQITDVLIVIEEAHNLLSKPEGIFYRIAKEGRKYGLGLLFSTQSPKTIPSEILSQTENFFVKHVSSEEDVIQLRKSKIAFAEPISDFILNEPIIGLSYVYMEPYQPFPVPVQIRLLEDIVKELTSKQNPT
jgi:hypothetical protein